MQGLSGLTVVGRGPPGCSCNCRDELPQEESVLLLPPPSASPQTVWLSPRPLLPMCNTSGSSVPQQHLWSLRNALCPSSFPCPSQPSPHLSSRLLPVHQLWEHLEEHPASSPCRTGCQKIHLMIVDTERPGGSWASLQESAVSSLPVGKPHSLWRPLLTVRQSGVCEETQSHPRSQSPVHPDLAHSVVSSCSSSCWKL